jgi:putative addiction module component (TIGR02574 family)
LLRTGWKKKIDFNDGISRIKIMSFAQVIEELPRFTVVERQELLRNVLELDDEGLSDSELALVEQRLAAYQADPARAVAVETMAERIRTKFSL